MDDGRPVKLFRNGRNQAVRIPREFELPGEDAIIRREGQRLVIEATPKPGLAEVLKRLAALGPLAEEDRLDPRQDGPPRPFQL